MITLEINNPNVESIFLEGFNANKEKFLEFIQNSYDRRESIKNYGNDKERFERTYTSMKNGSMEMLLEKDAKQEIDNFLDTL
jgi:hypothetical protein